jgi:hypothetical protein
VTKGLERPRCVRRSGAVSSNARGELVALRSLPEMLAIVREGSSQIGASSMSEAIEGIVSALVRLRDREALEKLRDHRRALLTDLNKIRADLNFNTSLAHRTIANDLAEIDAGLEQLS